MATRKPVPASEVRSWLRDHAESAGVPAPGARGKLSEAQIKAFEKGNKGKAFSHATFKPVRKVTAVVVSESGRKRPVTKNVNLPEVRAEAIKAGIPLGDRGRIPQTVLSAFVAGELATLAASL